MVACAALLLATVGAGMAPGSAPAASPLLLATSEVPAGREDIVPQWQRAMREIAAEQPRLDACRRQPAACPDRGTESWLRELDSLVGRPRLEQVRAVHAFVNRWRYRADTENYGRSDLWAAPIEFFQRSGDCEDYAIAKYVSLRRLGFAPGELRLVVLEDTVRDIAHAVLAVYLGAEILVLDNLADEVLPQQEVDHYVPYYSLNEVGHWLHAPLAAGPVAAGRDGEPLERR